MAALRRAASFGRVRRRPTVGVGAPEADDQRNIVADVASAVIGGVTSTASTAASVIGEIHRSLSFGRRPRGRRPPAQLREAADGTGLRVRVIDHLEERVASKAGSPVYTIAFQIATYADGRSFIASRQRVDFDAFHSRVMALCETQASSSVDLPGGSGDALEPTDQRSRMEEFLHHLLIACANKLRIDVLEPVSAELATFLALDFKPYVGRHATSAGAIAAAEIEAQILARRSRVVGVGEELKGEVSSAGPPASAPAATAAAPEVALTADEVAARERALGAALARVTHFLHSEELSSARQLDGLTRRVREAFAGGDGDGARHWARHLFSLRALSTVRKEILRRSEFLSDYMAIRITGSMVIHDAVLSAADLLVAAENLRSYQAVVPGIQELSAAIMDCPAFATPASASEATASMQHALNSVREPSVDEVDLTLGEVTDAMKTESSLEGGSSAHTLATEESPVRGPGERPQTAWVEAALVARAPAVAEAAAAAEAAAPSEAGSMAPQPSDAAREGHRAPGGLARGGAFQRQRSGTTRGAAPALAPASSPQPPERAAGREGLPESLIALLSEPDRELYASQVDTVSASYDDEVRTARGRNPCPRLTRGP